MTCLIPNTNDNTKRLVIVLTYQWAQQENMIMKEDAKRAEDKKGIIMIIPQEPQAKPLGRNKTKKKIMPHKPLHENSTSVNNLHAPSVTITKYVNVTHAIRAPRRDTLPTFIETQHLQQRTRVRMLEKELR